MEHSYAAAVGPHKFLTNSAAKNDDIMDVEATGYTESESERLETPKPPTPQTNTRPEDTHTSADLLEITTDLESRYAYPNSPASAMNLDDCTSTHHHA